MPNILRVSSVRSIYGRLFKFFTTSSESVFNKGKAINKPETNWELSDPSTTTVPPFIGPKSVTGNFMPFEMHFTPSCCRGLTMSPNCRPGKVPLPVTITSSLKSEPIAIISRAVKPDSPQSNIFCSVNSGFPCISKYSGADSTVAPISPAIPSIALASLQAEGK